MATLAVQFALVVAAGLVLAGGLMLMCRWIEGVPPERRIIHRRPPPAPGPGRRPLQVVAADLRRLSRQLALVPAGASLVRRRALRVAYDDVLTEAAEQLEVPHELPGTPPGMARDIERLRLLAALEGAGLRVRA
jgi:predicted alpha/beta-hydrolase family hydrolase